MSDVQPRIAAERVRSNFDDLDADITVSRFEGDDAEWDRFVAAADGSTFSHRAGWHGIMTDVLRHECAYLVAKDARGAWHGVLPLVHVRGLLGHYLLSMPFLNDGGPLGSDLACRRLVEHAVGEAERSGAKLLELRARHDLAGPVASSNRKITVHLPLPESIALLWEKTFKAKLRSQIRRPSKEGMVTRCGADELHSFYRVFSRNMRDLGTPVLPRLLFEQLASVFGNDILFTTVYTADGTAAAAACSLVWQDEVEIVWASSLREYNRLSPNMLLYARAIEESIVRGARVFNFGRCTLGSATHKFKLQWGGYDVPLPWPAWTRDGGAGTPSPDSPIMALAASIWSRLPMMIANRVGPLLSRHLP